MDEETPVRVLANNILDLSKQFCDTREHDPEQARSVSLVAIERLQILALRIRNLQDNADYPHVNPRVNDAGKYPAGTTKETIETATGRQLLLRDVCNRKVHKRPGQYTMRNPRPRSPEDHSLILAGDRFTATFTIEELVDAARAFAEAVGDEEF